MLAWRNHEPANFASFDFGFPNDFRIISGVTAEDNAYLYSLFVDTFAIDVSGKIWTRPNKKRRTV
jgi:hypothetical protein